MRNRVIAGVGLAFAATGSLAVAQQPPGTTYRAPGARPAAVARPVAPPVGSTVTYRFRGLNDSGIPRFASFMRVREDQRI